MRQGLILIFAPKNALGLIFRGCSVLRSCHLLLVAAQGWRVGFHLTRAYFGSRAYITSILKNHNRTYFQVGSYFQGNRVLRSVLLFLSLAVHKSMITLKIKLRINGRDGLYLPAPSEMSGTHTQYENLNITLILNSE